MQVYIVMYQDSNGQKYADDVFVDHDEAQMRAAELEKTSSSSWVIMRRMHVTSSAAVHAMQEAHAGIARTLD